MSFRSAISLSSETKLLQGNVEFQVHPFAVSGDVRDKERQ